MENLLKSLDGGDLRSIGEANEVVAKVLSNPKLFGGIFAGLLDSKPLIRMRATDAIENIPDIGQTSCSSLRGRS